MRITEKDLKEEAIKKRMKIYNQSREEAVYDLIKWLSW